MSKNPEEYLNFYDWAMAGMARGWCGPPVCDTHDGLPTSAEEDVMMWDEGDDICIHIIRLYHDESERIAVEENHAPSTWRKGFYLG